MYSLYESDFRLPSVMILSFDKPLWLAEVAAS